MGFINEIVWCYSPPRHSSKNLTISNQLIYWYGNNHIYNRQFISYNSSDKKNGTYKYYFDRYGIEKAEQIWKKGRVITNCWSDIPNLMTSKKGSVGYPTEKPYKLLERIICLSTKSSG